MQAVADLIARPAIEARGLSPRGFSRQLRGYTFMTPGPIAQLGERLHGMQEVAGSIPAGSI